MGFSLYKLSEARLTECGQAKVLVFPACLRGRKGATNIMGVHLSLKFLPSFSTSYTEWTQSHNDHWGC